MAAEWVMAIEQPERDPAGRPVADDTLVHAYDAEAGDFPHPFTRRSYVVHADRPWSGPAPRERCAQCVSLVPRQ